MRSKAHTALTAPLVLHHTRIYKRAMKKKSFSMAKCGRNIFWLSGRESNPGQPYSRRTTIYERRRTLQERKNLPWKLLIKPPIPQENSCIIRKEKTLKKLGISAARIAHHIFAAQQQRDSRRKWKLGNQGGGGARHGLRWNSLHRIHPVIRRNVKC